MVLESPVLKVFVFVFDQMLSCSTTKLYLINSGCSVHMYVSILLDLFNCFTHTFLAASEVTWLDLDVLYALLWIYSTVFYAMLACGFLGRPTKAAWSCLKLHGARLMLTAWWLHQPGWMTYADCYWLSEVCSHYQSNWSLTSSRLFLVTSYCDCDISLCLCISWL